MEKLQIIENKGVRVLTSKQIAEMYGALVTEVQKNYRNNKTKYQEGKHYFYLEGDVLKEYKRECVNCISFKGAKAIYLWTEKGALLHAKSLNTDKAWEVYDYLVDHYFRTQEIMQQSEDKKNNKRTIVDIPVNQEAQKQIQSLRDEMTAIESILVLIDRYQPAEDYEKLTYTLGQLCYSVAHQGYVIGNIKPKLIEKT